MLKRTSLSLIIALFLSVIIFESCSKDAVEKQQKGELNFSFKTAGNLKSKQDAKTIVVTISDLNGNVIYDHKELELFNFNGSFVSQSLSLPVGGYLLEDFMVYDAANKNIYVTPKKGSKYEHLVQEGLSISFSVNKDMVNKVVPDVISTDCNCATTDFGYVSFDFNVIEALCFLVNVQIYDPNATPANWVTTESQIVVNGDGVELFNQTVTAITDSVKVKDGAANFEIVVSKSGYLTKAITLTNAEIKAYKNEPLIIQLEE